MKKPQNIIELYKVAVDEITRLNPQVISIGLNLNISHGGVRFHIIVFDKNSDNKTVNFYDHVDINKNMEKLADVVNLLESDNFDEWCNYEGN